MVDYELIFSRRKTLGIYVYPGGRVVVRAPNRMPRRDIRDFVVARADWLAGKKREMAAVPRPNVLSYANGEMHHFLGDEYELQVTSSPKFAVYQARGSLVVGLPKSDDPRSIKKGLIRWYRAQGLEICRQQAEILYPFFAELGALSPSIRVRQYKARWGSCSTSGEITLSLDLVRYPLHLIEYVIAHEMCHLLEFNHSARFYSLMTEVMPDWRVRKKELEGLANIIESF